MTSYYIEIKQCPRCNCKFKELAVASCNTIGAKFFTDGFMVGPMYSTNSALLICPECHTYFWREDVPTWKTMRDHQYFRDTNRQFFPNAMKVGGRQYESALRQALWRTETQEKYIRIRVWWSFNDSYRNQNTENFHISHEQKSNLERLLNLIDTNNFHEIIMKAEILRELGRFDECLSHLDHQFDEKYMPTVEAIRKLAAGKKRRVMPIELTQGATILIR